VAVDGVQPAATQPIQHRGRLVCTELSMYWVDPWVGLGRYFFLVFGGLGWIGSTLAKVLKT